MVNPLVERTAKVVGAIARGARRPQTLPTQARELASGLITGALYPFGFFDAGPGGRVRARTSTGSGTTPVLLVHGYLANKSNWYFVERALRQVGYEGIHGLNYSPRNADVDELARVCVLRAHEVMAAAGSERIHLVGHSLGGLVIRRATQTFGLHEAASVVTVATPHGGVDLARFGPLIGGRNTIARQLRPGSEWLRSMWATTSALPDTRYVAYYSNLDLLVPGRRAMMLEHALGATNILMKDHGHLSVMLAASLATSIAQELAAIDGLAGHGRPVTSLPVSPGAAVPTAMPQRALALH